MEPERAWGDLGRPASQKTLHPLRFNPLRAPFFSATPEVNSGAKGGTNEIGGERPLKWATNSFFFSRPPLKKNSFFASLQKLLWGGCGGDLGRPASLPQMKCSSLRDPRSVRLGSPSFRFFLFIQWRPKMTWKKNKVLGSSPFCSLV